MRAVLFIVTAALVVAVAALPRFHDVLLSKRARDPQLEHDCAGSLRLAARWLLKNRKLGDVNILYALRAVQGALGEDAAGVRALVHALTPYAKKRDPTFGPLEYLVRRKHRIDEERRIPFGLFGNLEQSPNARVFSEHFSDKCMHELFNGCRITADCDKFMFTNETYKDYQTTHKALYFILWTRLDCSSHHKPPMDPTVMLGRQIVAMWSQQHHEVPHLKHWVAGSRQENDPDSQLRYDIFRERMAIAGQEGYTQFLKPDWIRGVISSQQREGCWGAPCDMHQTAVSIIPLAAYLHFTHSTHLV